MVASSIDQSSSSDPAHLKLGKVPLRLVLIVPFVLEILVAVGLTGWFSLRNGQRAVNDLAAQLEYEVANRIQQHLEDYLSVPEQINQSNAEAIRLDLLDLEDPTQLSRTFWQQIQIFESISYISLGLQQTGGFVDAGRQSDGTLVIEMTEGFTAGDFLTYGTDADANLTELIDRSDEPYDPRLRPWYIQAVEQGKTVWSEPYSLFPDMDLAITAATPIYAANSQALLGVVATDLTLSEINDFLQTLEIGASGEAFVIERSGLLIGTSTDQLPFVQVTADEEPKRLSVVDIEVSLIQSTAQALLAEFGDFQNINQSQALITQFQRDRQYVRVLPFQDDLGLDWLIVVTVPESDFMAQINANTRNTILLCLAALCVSTLLGLLTSRWITGPIDRLTQASRAFKNGQLGQQLAGSSITELNILAQAFDQMQQQLKASFDALGQTNIRLEKRVEERTNELSSALANLQRTQSQLVQTEKMSSLGQLVAGVAHEINNPVSYIQGNLVHAMEYSQQLLNLVDLYQQQYPEPGPTIQTELEEIDLEFLQEDFPQLLGSMKTGAQRIAEIVQSLRNFSRLDEAEFKQVDIHDGIDSTLMFLHNRFKRSPTRPDIQVIKEYGKIPDIECYPGKLNQVFMHLIVNAVDTLNERDEQRLPAALKDEPSWIRIQTQYCVEGDASNWIKICVIDNGLGMSATTQSRVFDPFFTSKSVGQGTGLGLSISYQIIVDKHGGKLEFSSTEGKGTTFMIKLPIKQ
ncbi:MAG: HAMP domain-containing protein [Leptolyngbya sp. SIOISBB]|nr:HAMP domain-containing protein [Leptolyngbya sp. SIOISBB]